MEDIVAPVAALTERRRAMFTSGKRRGHAFFVRTRAGTWIELRLLCCARGREHA